MCSCFKEEWYSTAELPTGSIGSEKVNRMDKEIPKKKKRERKIKTQVILKNSVCLLKQVEVQSSSLQNHELLQGSAPQIIPSEQRCSSTFPLHQFIQQHKTHLSSKKQITASQLMILAQQFCLMEMPEQEVEASSVVRAPWSTPEHLRLEMRAEPPNQAPNSAS